MTIDDDKAVVEKRIPTLAVVVDDGDFLYPETTGRDLVVRSANQGGTGEHSQGREVPAEAEVEAEAEVDKGVYQETIVGISHLQEGDPAQDLMKGE